MQLPILQKLMAGETFDFETLAENVEQTDEFFEWWWDQRADKTQISRPEIISQGEPILTETIGKATVDLSLHRDFFDRTLFRAGEDGRISVQNHYPREAFRQQVSHFVYRSSCQLKGRPEIVFAGGGYGSGKTTILNWMADSGCLPVRMAHHVGVDVVKSLIPEYHLIKAVADGRASWTVQKECVKIASDLYEKLVANGRSFIWDSSMSDEEVTLKRIQFAREQGYGLTLIGVLTPLAVATQQAMQRARETRRFPHPKALPESNRGFKRLFFNYVPLFDEITVVANSREGGTVPIVVAEKHGLENELAILSDPEIFTRYVTPD